MAVKLQHDGFIFSRSSSNPCLWRNSIASSASYKRVSHLERLMSNWGSSRKKCLTRLAFLGNGNHGVTHRTVGFERLGSAFWKQDRAINFQPLASSDDGVTVNGSPSVSSNDDVEEIRIKLTQSLRGKDYGDRLVQSLHDAARVFELAIKDHGLLSILPWLSTAWLGIDKNAWVKTLSYQASVYCLLQAACEISSRGDGRDRDINIFVQRSLLRQSAPLESLIRDKLSAKQPEACEWFWAEQVPPVVTSFVAYFEEDPRFFAATDLSGKSMLVDSGNGSDISLLLLALTCVAAITKLGPTKVSCPQFFSMISDITGRLMDMLVDFIPIRQAYHSTKELGLRREFLVHFGPRAAACRVKNEASSEEVVFWVNLVQKQLQRAIDREKIWSRLTTSESIEVLEKDLAIFGFFIALGRSTKSYLCANGFDVIDDPIEGFVRYLIGGSVLYYPQLSSISSYQLYVEVVCEELDWLPFYPGNAGSPLPSHGRKKKEEGPPNAEAIPQVLDVCSYWMWSFIKYSKWLEGPSNVKAAKFLSMGHDKLTECTEELKMSRKLKERSGNIVSGRTKPGIDSLISKETDSFDKALESVEEAVIRLERLLQELHVSSSNSGKEQLKAACSDLEKIRKLKNEAEFLEASFRAKADSLQQGEDENDPPSSNSDQKQYIKEKRKMNENLRPGGSRNFQGLWNFFGRTPIKSLGPNLQLADIPENEHNVIKESSRDPLGSDSNDMRRFEVLRNELMELEKRVQRWTDQSVNEENVKFSDGKDTINDETGSAQLVKVQRKENIIGKSFDKLKVTSTDVLQGTQLLVIDVAAAMGLLRRALIGDELTEKEKQALRRTMTDLASVIPIGFLMLLPVTAVGHAAMLAFIQRYIPTLIPSTYGPERLDLLRQLEKMKEIKTSKVDAKENGEELA